MSDDYAFQQFGARFPELLASREKAFYALKSQDWRERMAAVDALDYRWKVATDVMSEVYKQLALSDVSDKVRTYAIWAWSRIMAHTYDDDTCSLLARVVLTADKPNKERRAAYSALLIVRSARPISSTYVNTSAESIRQEGAELDASVEATLNDQLPTIDLGLVLAFARRPIVWPRNS